MNVCRILYSSIFHVIPNFRACSLQRPTSKRVLKQTDTKTSSYCHRRLHCCTLLSAAATEPRATMRKKDEAS